METAEATRTRRVAMVGNPNVGKSTLFNQLTGLRQKVANYPGVTVDVRVGARATSDGELQLLDLPGTYSLHPRAADEAIVLRALRGDEELERPDVVVAVLDATNLRRNLYLLSEVCDLGLPVVVALNMVDEARRGGLEVPTAALREATGLEVVETVASRGEGIGALAAALDHAAEPAPRRWKFDDAALEERLAAAPGETTWARLQALEADDPTARERAIGARYAWIAAALHGQDEGARLRGSSDRLDRVLLHPVLGPLVFLTVMTLLFQSIFAWAEPAMQWIEAWVTYFQGAAAGMFSEGHLLGSLLSDGAIAGVGAVVVFLPQIVILFLLLGILEDSGYMARAAFLVDRPLRTVGLSGRSFIPLLSSFACAVPGVMATRTIPSRFERTLAILAAPLMTCSARLPVYTLLIGAFVPATTVAGVLNLQGLVMLALYLSGLAAGLLVALAVTLARRRGRRRGRELPMVVELPPYRRPSPRDVLLKLKLRVGDFLKRAGTVIFAVSVVLWVLMSFPRVGSTPPSTPAEKAAQLEQSYAGRMGHAIEPVIRPLGYDWKMGVGLIASFAAREVFVSTMGVVYSVGDEADENSEGLRQALREERDPITGRKTFTLATVFSLLAFYVIALQCGATVAVIKRETASWKFAAAQVVGYLALAWVAAFVTYRVMAAFGYA